MGAVRRHDCAAGATAPSIKIGAQSAPPGGVPSAHTCRMVSRMIMPSLSLAELSDARMVLQLYSFIWEPTLTSSLW